MRLEDVQITEFQSIRDSGEFKTGNITCLVGKNEAGKTALLQSLYRLNPYISGDGQYSVTHDYPRSDVDDYRISVEDRGENHAVVAQATFLLDEDDKAAITDIFGKKALKSDTLRLTKGYENKLRFRLEIDEALGLANIVKSSNLSAAEKSQLGSLGGVSDLSNGVESLEQTEAVQELSNLAKSIAEYESVSSFAYKSLLGPRVPKFLFFDEYYQMEGRANVPELKLRMDDDDLLPSDYPLLGLIELARLDLDDLMNPRETRELKNRLEGASNHLSKTIVKYWSQNRHLQLRFDVREGLPEDPEGMREGMNIWGEVNDLKRYVTTELGTRSRGFVWFFSFLAWYSQIRSKNENVILLLDEPGLWLHAKAQEDLLGYFDAEVRGNHQLVYTTHSPFMVDSARFDRVRIVQDLSLEEDDIEPDQEGTKVLTEVLEATDDSLFPLQGALGYEIYQTLFVGPNSLVVEGVSDLLYLQSFSALLQQAGKTGLSSQWTITPVGGSDKVPTFVALIGAQSDLNVAVLIDYQKKDKQSIENLYKRKLLKKSKVITYSDFVEEGEADIEDLIGEDLYLKLVNSEYSDSLAKPITGTDLTDDSPRILKRLEHYFNDNPLQDGASFNHYRPARYFTENVQELQTEMANEVQDRFEAVFKRLNKLL